MESVLIIVVLAGIVLFAAGRRPSQPQIIYVYPEAPSQPSSLGCLPLLVLAVLLVAALDVIRF